MHYSSYQNNSLKEKNGKCKGFLFKIEKSGYAKDKSYSTLEKPTYYLKNFTVKDYKELQSFLSFKMAMRASQYYLQKNWFLQNYKTKEPFQNGSLVVYITSPR